MDDNYPTGVTEDDIDRATSFDMLLEDDELVLDEDDFMDFIGDDFEEIEEDIEL